MMKKIYTISFLFLFSLFAISCGTEKKEEADNNGAGTENGENPGVTDDGWEVLGDVTFENGLAVSLLDPKDVTANGGFEKTNPDTLYFNNDKVNPTWQMAQWYSKHDIAHAQPIRHSDNSIEYSNKGKKIVRYEDGSLLLEIITSTEYEHPRVDGENWPHLLIEQAFKKCPNIGTVKALNFSIALQLIKCDNKMNDGEYDTNYHTAQSPLYFILRNVNSKSADYNKSIWLGIQSFDYRYEKMREDELISWDLGTDMYIYNVPQIKIWGDIKFQDMKVHEAKVDILPLVKDAVNSMKSKDIFTSTTLDDLELVSINFGWEIPGTFDTAIKVKGISLKAQD